MCIEEFGLPGVVLMENAGRGCAELLLSESAGGPGPVAILCGTGNNGGDGFVIARHLAAAGADVHLFIPFPEPPAEHDDPGEAAMNARVCRAMGLPWRDWTAPDPDDLAAALAEVVGAGGWVVDALLGTGITGPPRSPTDAAVLAINAAASRGAKVLAVDVPSGLNADTGRPFPFPEDHPEAGSPGPCVRADLTASFVAKKVGYDATGAGEYTGAVRVVGIGAPPAAIDAATR